MRNINIYFNNCGLENIFKTKKDPQTEGLYFVNWRRDRDSNPR